MRLVREITREPVGVGSIISFETEPVTIVYCPKPHSPASSGKVTCQFPDGSQCEYYAGVWGLEWIEREDRQPISVQEAMRTGNME